MIINLLQYCSYVGCVSARFTTCCEPSSTQSCVVNDGQIDMCSCDAGCFANDTCCFDILDVPCLPGKIFYHPL